jgi:SAM-dependent methyltransferase
MASDTCAPYAGRENLEVMQEAENYNRYLLSLISHHVQPDGRVADFGAGVGTLAVPLRERGVDVLCVEPDTALQGELRRAGLRVCGDLGGVADAGLDLIYTFNVLEHIADDRGTLRTLAKKLKPGGKLLIYVPAFAVLFTAMDRKVGHLRRYRRAPLTTLVRDAGLKVDEARYVDSLGFFATLAYRALGRADGSIDRRALRAYDRLVFPLSRVCDRLLSPCVGKNLVVVASKP